MFQDHRWCETGVYHVPLAFECIYGVIFEEEGREWRLSDPLYTDDLVLYDESED